MSAIRRRHEDPNFVALVLAAVAAAVQEVIDEGATDGRTGGYFCLMDFETNDLLIRPTKIGEVTNGKDDQYTRNCLEKAKRLSVIRQMSISVPVGEWDFGKYPGWTSFELRDESRQQWGGAIVTAALSEHPYIFSFSGFPEEADEAAMILAAVKLEILGLEEARAVALRSPTQRHADGSNSNQIILRHMQRGGTLIVGG